MWRTFSSRRGRELPAVVTAMPSVSNRNVALDVAESADFRREKRRFVGESELETDPDKPSDTVTVREAFRIRYGA